MSILMRLGVPEGLQQPMYTVHHIAPEERDRLLLQKLLKQRYSAQHAKQYELDSFAIIETTAAVANLKSFQYQGTITISE